jgi:hypothetical protein
VRRENLEEYGSRMKCKTPSVRNVGANGANDEKHREPALDPKSSRALTPHLIADQ